MPRALACGGRAPYPVPSHGASGWGGGGLYLAPSSQATQRADFAALLSIGHQAEEAVARANMLSDELKAATAAFTERTNAADRRAASNVERLEQLHEVTTMTMTPAVVPARSLADR